MRYILLVLLAFVTTFASAQVQFLGSPTTTVRNRGNFVSDSLFYLPKRTKAPSDTGALRYQISDSALYVWTGSAWRSTGTAGSAITGSGVAGYMPEFTTSTNLDTTRLYHSAGRFAIGSTTTTNGVFNVIGGTTYLEGNLSFGAADRTISNISNNVLAFGTNNTERMRIGANGDVAIGTTNADPFARGDDRRIAMDASGISSTANVALSLNAGSSAGRGAQLYLGVGGTRHFEISSNSVEQGISAISNTYIKFLTNNTERMRLKADGELLIGSNVDQGAYALQVAGAIYNTTGAVLAASSGNVGIGTASPLTYGGAKLAAYQSSGATIIASKSDDVSGSAGIYLEGNDASNNIIQLRQFSTSASGTISGISLASGSFLYTSATSAGPLALVQQASQPILFASGGSERMRIKSDGEVLIGTTTDAGAYALQVAGAIYNTTGGQLAASSGNVQFGANQSYIYNSYDSIAALFQRVGTFGPVIRLGRQGVANQASLDVPVDGFFAITTAGSERLRIQNNGEVLIGTTTDAGVYALQVTGAIYNTTTITTGAPSGGTAKPFKIGAAATVSPTSPNRTIEIEIDGTTYYLHAKTTND